MTLTYKDAMAYALWRWADIARRPIPVATAEALVDEMLALVPRSARRALARPHRNRRHP